MSNIYWVGIRESDLISIENIYCGSITYFGSGNNNNIALFKIDTPRKNHNEDLPIFIEFIERSIKSILEADIEAEFMLYNPILAYSLDCELQKHIICLNDKRILKIINNKISCRHLLKDDVKMLQNIEIIGKKIDLYDLMEHWCEHNEFVVQMPVSSGGLGTFVINENNFLKTIQKLDPDDIYLISPYYRNAISLNVHCVIYDNEFQLYPVSIQITKNENGNLVYKGCDFTEAQSLKKSIKNQIIKESEKICKILIKNNYKGVCGIDFILIDEKIYFSEINPRFQASTASLNVSLAENDKNSINESTICAFSENYQPQIEDYNFHNFYSIYSYEQNSEQTKFNNNIFNTYFSIYPEYELFKDGYDINLIADKGAYLFRVLLPYSIISITNNELRFNELLCGYTLNNTYDPLQLKIMLLNLGITISPETLHKIQEQGVLREANFSAIDIIIEEKFIVNCPYKTNHSEFSPFNIQTQNGILYLCFFEEVITDIKIYFESKLNKKRTKTGIYYNSVAFLATDRLRVNYNPVCYYKQINKGCKFCNLPNKNQQYSFEDTKTIVDDFLQNELFRHILLGGGSNKPTDDFGYIIKLSEYLKQNTNKPLYLMSLPPKNMDILKKLHNTGIQEIAFNIEIFDQNSAEYYMPGKGLIPREHYFEMLEKAVSLWGKEGNVRSMVIIGLEPKESFLDGIERLCKIGVQPMLSIFRPMENTPLHNILPPSSKDIMLLYEEAKKICNKYGVNLGPSCSYCQNNTLCISSNIELKNNN